MKLIYKKRFFTFTPPHTKTSGYFHHHKQFSNLSECCHCQSNFYRFVAVCFEDNNACNDDYHSRQNINLHIICGHKMPFYHYVFVFHFITIVLMVFDGLGFLFVCLHLLHNALYFLWMDFHPWFYIYIYIYIYRVSFVEERTLGTYQNIRHSWGHITPSSFEISNEILRLENV
jgi:hypothetical protein